MCVVCGVLCVVCGGCIHTRIFRVTYVLPLPYTLVPLIPSLLLHRHTPRPLTIRERKLYTRKCLYSACINSPNLSTKLDRVYACGMALLQLPKHGALDPFVTLPELSIPPNYRSRQIIDPEAVLTRCSDTRITKQNWP